MENRPIKKLKAGCVELALWENVKDGKKFKSVSLSKKWINKAGEWKDQTINFRDSDVQKALLVLSEIHKEIYLNNDK